ncbi:MAG: peptidoglycan editing factor PgeF [Pseudomonadales bacterium]|nr:peptidoglycan editing factor PgeF [Pseudomonadales bacterium]
MPDWIIPDWPAPENVKALVTTRRGGVSGGASEGISGGVSPAPWDSLNLATHVGDLPERVEQNRQWLQQQLALHHQASRPVQWLNQIHGIEVVEAALSDSIGQVPSADAIFTTQPGLPIAVLTADCLPVFFCDQRGTQVAVAHAGWRGLSAGILEKTAASFSSRPDQLLVWLGPAIGPKQFEVGDEVRQQIVEQAGPGVDCSPFFKPANQKPNHWLADLYQIARAKLNALGIKNISGGEFCTVEQSQQFFSYRRDGQTGRMASVILLTDLLN